MEKTMTEATTETRVVTIYSNVGAKKTTINLNNDVVTWGHLKSLVTQAGQDLSKRRVVVGETNVTLDLDDAELPKDSFSLFLCDIKVKSGGTFSKEILEKVEKTIKLKKGVADSAKRVGLSVEDYLEARSIVKNGGIATTKKEVKKVEPVKSVVTKKEPKATVSVTVDPKTNSISINISTTEVKAEVNLDNPILTKEDALNLLSEIANKIPALIAFINNQPNVQTDIATGQEKEIEAVPVPIVPTVDPEEEKRKAAALETEKKIAEDKRLQEIEDKKIADRMQKMQEEFRRKGL